MISERIVDPDNLPINENLDRFAIPYTPEVFTEEEQKFLRPFFTNLDRPVFITHNLPEEVNAALDSKYSRSTLSKRRLFLKEYVAPIVYPDQQKDWEDLSVEKKNEALGLKERFIRIVDFMNSGGTIDAVANVQRARDFFDKWLSGFGDDSIAEMGAGIHLSMEGISSLALEEVVSKRIGVSPLVKSTRYVPFQEKRVDGQYQYVVPGEIKGTDIEPEYVRVMDLLFSTYANVSAPYLEYIEGLYPKGVEETDLSFLNSRKAKRLDDTRDLLTFSTQNNIGLAGNGRAYEDLINRLLGSSLGELRWIGQQSAHELATVVPSFVARPVTVRGAEIQLYRENLMALRDQIAAEIKGDSDQDNGKRWAKLVTSTPDAEVEVLAAYIYGGSLDQRKSLTQIREAVRNMSVEQRCIEFQRIFALRKSGRTDASQKDDRFKKVPRAFEVAHYTFEIHGRGGDKRDLHRHRMLTDLSQPFTTQFGYDLEEEVLRSPFIGLFRNVLGEADGLYNTMLQRFGPEVAQYAVPFTFIQRWVVHLSAREIYWEGELRTGRQARPHYKRIVLDMVDLATEADPNLFSGIMVDRNDYRLARRESEKKIELRKG